MSCRDEQSGTEIAANELQYLLADKTWKDAIINIQDADKVIDKLVELGFAKPSKIQSKTIPFALTKRNVGILAQSHNGSGKTLSFVLPSVLRVDLSKPLMKSQTMFSPQAIIICPNIELCTQVVKIVELIASPFKDLKVSSGKEPAHILVKTPKGMLNLLGSKTVNFSGVDLLVIDEADDQIQGESGANIVQIVSKLPKTAGLFFFSATYTEDSIKYINNSFSQAGITFVLRYMLKAEELKLAGIHQFSRKCESGHQKAEYIDKLLQNLESDMQYIIFANTKKFAQQVYTELQKRGHSIALLMGGLLPQERSEIFNSFKQGKFKILMTTNLLARGFDQRTIGLVINLDIPKHYGENIKKADCETYLHRIGRTGRFGDVGLALNLYANDEEKSMLKTIEQFYQVEIKDLTKSDQDAEFDMLNKFLEQVSKVNAEKRKKGGENIINPNQPK